MQLTMFDILPALPFLNAKQMYFEYFFGDSEFPRASQGFDYSWWVEDWNEYNSRADAMRRTLEKWERRIRKVRKDKSFAFNVKVNRNFLENRAGAGNE